MPRPLEIPRPEDGDAVVVTRAPLGRIHSVETFGLVDGPGVRYVALLQGCHMRCQYCHNPETWGTKPRTDRDTGETVGASAECSAEDLFNKAWRYHNYWSNNGGVTVGGGEPLLQMEFVRGFFELLKERGVHTALDTAGGPFRDVPAWLSRFEKLMNVTDLVLLDLKAMNPTKHKELTGWDNAHILAMARWLSDHGKSMWIRRVLVPGITDDEKDLLALRDFVDELETVQRVEILPYNMMAQLKWEQAGMDYPLEGILEPTPEQIARAEELLGIPS